MVILLASGIAGGVATSLTASFWLGTAGSIALAPLGGSMAALLAGLAVAARRAEAARRIGPTPLLTTDAQVSALREIAARGRAPAADQSGSEKKAPGQAA
jgi:hypothetical protein